MLKEVGFKDIEIGAAVDTFGGAKGENNTGAFDVRCYPFLAWKPGYPKGRGLNTPVGVRVPPEFGIGGQTARPVHGGQHPVSTSALRNARSRNEFNASSHPVGPALSAGSGRGFGVCFGSVLLLSSL